MKGQIAEKQQKKQSVQRHGSDLKGIMETLGALKDSTLEYDDIAVRQFVECIQVQSDDRIRVVFKGGLVYDISV